MPDAGVGDLDHEHARRRPPALTCTLPPRGVNFTALRRRFDRTCCTRAPSSSSAVTAPRRGRCSARPSPRRPAASTRSRPPASDDRCRGRELEPQLARDQPRHVEQVRGELRLQLRVALDGARARAARLPASSWPGPQQLDPAEHRVERRAQLVRERGQELVLQPVGLLGLRGRGARSRARSSRRRLGAPPLGDVEEGPDGAPHLALVVEQRHRVLVQRKRVPSA